MDKERITSVALFADLSDEQLEKLAGTVKEWSASSGDTLIQREDSSFQLFAIEDGSVEVCKHEEARLLGLVEPLQGERVLLEPLLAEHVPELRRIVATPDVLRWWGPQEPGWALDDEDAESWTIRHNERIVGLIQASEENEPRFRYAGIDIFLDSSAHGQGLGTDAVYTLARHLIRDRGHHRLVIDPAADNAVAIRCYEKVAPHGPAGPRAARPLAFREIRLEAERGKWHPHDHASARVFRE